MYEAFTPSNTASHLKLHVQDTVIFSQNAVRKKGLVTKCQQHKRIVDSSYPMQLFTVNFQITHPTGILEMCWKGPFVLFSRGFLQIQQHRHTVKDLSCSDTLVTKCMCIQPK
jgi:hypothetical protein